MPSGWKSGTHRAPEAREAGRLPSGASQEAGQACIGSILSLELHGGWAVRPLQREENAQVRSFLERSRGVLGCVSALDCCSFQAA